MTFTKLVRKLKKESCQLKIVCLGLDNAGKTTILHSMFNLPNKPIDPTFGYSLYKCIYDSYTILLYDVGGQVCFKEYWNNYFECADGIIFVFDISDSRPYKEDLINITKMVPGTPVLVLANKNDLSSITFKDESSKHINYFSVCGHLKESLEKPFKWLIETCQKIN